MESIVQKALELQTWQHLRKRLKSTAGTPNESGQHKQKISLNTRSASKVQRAYQIIQNCLQYYNGSREALRTLYITKLSLLAHLEDTSSIYLERLHPSTPRIPRYRFTCFFEVKDVKFPCVYGVVVLYLSVPADISLVVTSFRIVSRFLTCTVHRYCFALCAFRPHEMIY